MRCERSLAIPEGRGGKDGRGYVRSTRPGYGEKTGCNKEAVKVDIVPLYTSDTMRHPMQWAIGTGVVDIGKEQKEWQGNKIIYIIPLLHH